VQHPETGIDYDLPVEHLDRATVRDSHKRVLMAYARLHNLYSAQAALDDLVIQVREHITARGFKVKDLLDKKPESFQDCSMWPTKVYFIKNVDSGRIKIGQTSTPVKKRLAALQTACDGRLTLLGAVPSRAEFNLTERDLHAQFWKWNVGNFGYGNRNTRQTEWFKPEIEPEVSKLIQMYGIDPNQ
jgi:hypothetical protein